MSSATPLDALTFPLYGARLIEASAGTGKTYTIAALYVRLILGHDSDIKHSEALIAQKGIGQMQVLLPPDILVVTFTEASTQELRERIRARLTQASAYFRQKISDEDDFLQRLRGDFLEADWPSCAYRLELAANWMDEAAVYTIHGWCNRMLQQHAFESGSLFSQEVDNDDQTLLQQTVCDYWRQFFYTLSETACLAVYKLASSPDQLAQALKSLLFESEAVGLECENTDIHQAFKVWETWETQRRALESQAQTEWSNQQTTIEKLLIEASESGWLNANLYRKAGFNDKLQQMAKWAIDGEYQSVEALAKFGQQKLQTGLTKAHQTKADQFEVAAFRSIDLLAAHCEQEIDISRLITLHAIHWIRQRYNREKQRMARMTFDDMLTRLDLALQGPNAEPLASTIRKQYPIALIDEFQDTDPVQYRIFARLYATQDPSINTGTDKPDLNAEIDYRQGCFMIGDPKQAIYSFRGGDIFTYLKAHQATLGRHYTLDTNFRSTNDLVAAVNQIFNHGETEQSEGAFCFKTDQINPLPFLPVNAQGRNEIWVIEKQAAPALTFWQTPSATPIGMPDYRQQMAEATASEIVRLLSSGDLGQSGFITKSGEIRPLQPADIAILVRSGTEAKVMRRALTHRQLRSVYLSERESIYATPEAMDLLIWLKALANPRDERKVRAAVSTATFGWSYQDLQQLVSKESAWEQQLERFLIYQQRWRQDGILPTLHQLMNDYALPARLMTSSDGERHLTNLLHLAELLQQASSHLEGEQALIRHLAQAIGDAHQSADESVIRLESDANLIKIVTIHKSKGLEYPLVFLPFICSFREVSSRNNRYYRYHDADLNLSIDLGKADSSKVLSDKERLQEDLRLLYVAVTRAQYACWLGIAAIKNQNSKYSQLEKSAMGYLLGWQAGMSCHQLDEQLNKLKSGCLAINIVELPEPSQDSYHPQQQSLQLDAVCHSSMHIADHWWIASYSALQVKNKTPTEAVESAPSLEYPYAEVAPGVLPSATLAYPYAAENYWDDKQGDEADVTTPNLATGLGIHGLPRGAGPGVLIHELLEQTAQLGFNHVFNPGFPSNPTQAQPEPGRQLIDKIFKSAIWEHKHDILEHSLQQWLKLPLLENNPLSLSSLSKNQYQAEMEFLLGVDNADVKAIDNLIIQYTFDGKPRLRLLPNQLNGLLKGFIDLVFMHNDQYYVLDYKFNSLGNNEAAYSEWALESAMLNKRYDLQAILYLLALHRLLKLRLGDRYDFDTHIGGGIYLFLRGAQTPGFGRIMIKPPKILIEALDSLFCGEHVVKACS